MAEVAVSHCAGSRVPCARPSSQQLTITTSTPLWQSGLPSHASQSYLYTFHVLCITKQLFHMSLLVNYFNCFVISGSRYCSVWSGLDRGDEDVQCLPGGDTSQGLPSPSPRRPRRRALTSSPHCYLLVAQESQKKEFRTGPKENREKYKSCWHFDHVIYYCSLVPTLGVSFCTHFFKYSYC